VEVARGMNARWHSRRRWRGRAVARRGRGRGRGRGRSSDNADVVAGTINFSGDALAVAALRIRGGAEPPQIGAA